MGRAKTKSANFEQVEQIRINRATRKGKQAGQRAVGTPEELFKKLRSHNPYTNGDRAQAWASGFDAMGSPATKEG